MIDKKSEEYHRKIHLVNVYGSDFINASECKFTLISVKAK